METIGKSYVYDGWNRENNTHRNLEEIQDQGLKNAAEEAVKTFLTKQVDALKVAERRKGMEVAALPDDFDEPQKRLIKFTYNKQEHQIIYTLNSNMPIIKNTSGYGHKDITG